MAIAHLTRLFKTLSDPTRLRLLRLMAESELSVMEMAEATQLAQSRVSNHLKLLREEGFVQERRDGSWRHYRVDLDRLPGEVRDLWPGIEAAWATGDEFEADRKRLQGVLARRSARDGAFFDRISGRWDAIRDEMFGDSIARSILRAFLPTGMVVADIGAGTGYVTELFGDRAAKIIAVDNNEAMLAVAGEKVGALGLENVEFRLGDAHDPPLAAGEADLVTFVMVLHHLDDPGRALRNAAAALRPGGRLLVADFTEHQETWLREMMQHRWLGFREDALEGYIAGAGLAVNAWSVLPGRPWMTPENKRVTVPDGFVALLGGAA